MARPSPLAAPGSLRNAAERGRRRSGVRAFAFLGFAAFAAVASAVVMSRYLEAQTTAARVPTAPVVVAAVDIPLATSVRVEALRTVDWPLSSVPENAISDPAKLVGRVPIFPLVRGEPVVEAKLASNDAGTGLSALLPEGHRAVAVRVDDVVGVAGFLHPSDHVDVIVTMKPKDDGDSPTVSKIILQNIRVLAVGKEVGQSGRGLDKTVPATVATLMVDSAQSEELALASTKGKLLLSLRSRLDTSEVPTSGVVPPVLLAGAHGVAVQPQQPAVAHGRTPHPRRPAVRIENPKVIPVRQTVEVIRGDLYEKRDFGKDDAGSKR